MLLFCSSHNLYVAVLSVYVSVYSFIGLREKEYQILSHSLTTYSLPGQGENVFRPADESTKLLLYNFTLLLSENLCPKDNIAQTLRRQYLPCSVTLIHSLHIHISFSFGFNETHGNLSTTGVSECNQKNHSFGQRPSHKTMQEATISVKVGWRKWTKPGGFSCAVTAEAICLEEIISISLP